MSPDLDAPAPTLLHIIGRDEWSAALAAGEPYRAPDQDAVGFLHLSTPELVLVPANSFYGGRSDLVLLVVDADRVSSELRFEDGVPPVGDLQFPHLYGPLDLDAVVDVVDFPCGPDGRFDLPDSLTPGH
jgi:uncharacterized protein (DUF952 family)